MRQFVIFLLLFFACTPALPKVIFHTTENIPIIVEIADSPEEWAQGLVSREHLAEDAGMLFVFPDEAERTFWMKDTLIPLDLIFVNSEKEIVKITTAPPCLDDPCPTYTSNAPAKYVVEVNAGFAERNGIIEGTIIDGPAGI